MDTRARVFSVSRLISLLTLCLLPTGVLAAELQVNNTSDTIADDGNCTLREAVIAANTNTASGVTLGECAAGDDINDMIRVPAGTYTLALGPADPFSLILNFPQSGDLDIQGDVAIIGNVTGGTIIDGGGIDRVFHVVSGDATLSHLTIQNGNANDSLVGVGGGGVLNFSDLTIIESTVQNNFANGASAIPDNGGGVFNSGTLNIRNSAILGNQTVTNGGGLYNFSGTVTITNSTFGNNTANNNGGGIMAVGGTVNIGNATLAQNTADADTSGGGNGGGIRRSGGTVTIKNSIVIGNTDNGTEAPDCSGTIASGFYNIIGDLTGCGGLTPDVTDQTGVLLSAVIETTPAFNNGYTLNYALVAGSLAFNTGNPAGCTNFDSPTPALLLQDQIGAPRPDVLGNNCDIGAREDLDFDNDGEIDSVDNCPVDANPLQENNDSDSEGDVCDADDDNDGVTDATPDNCQFVANPGQEDTNSDGEGDACDGDIDGDGVANGSDNCPNVANPGQENNDGDSDGDVCDTDDDNDTVDDVSDNCPNDANLDQADKDNDGAGDVCDTDDDGDGVDDTTDNCPLDTNATQTDTDGDGDGDACDTDDDGDGIDDTGDNCPNNANPDQTDSDGDGTGDLCDPTPDVNPADTDTGGTGIGNPASPSGGGCGCWVGAQAIPSMPSLLVMLTPVLGLFGLRLTRRK